MGSTKNFLRTFHSISAASMAGNVTSPASNIQGYDNVSMQITFTGTPTGSFVVEVSNDHNQDSQGVVSVAGTWNALPLSPSPVASGSGSTITIDMNQLPAPWIRLVYTASSGTGTLDMYLSAKGI